MEFENTPVEETTEAATEEEVAEPLEESQMEGSNETELAEQSSEFVAEPQDSSTNKAFQEMRRKNKELEEQLASLKAESEARATAFSRIAGEDADDISVLAEATGMSADEIAREFNSAKEKYELEAKNKALEEELLAIHADKAMAEDLATIRRIDPKIESLDELGEQYINYIKAGLNAEDAYWAVKAKDSAYRAKPAPEVGVMNTAPPEKEYFTDAEIEAMSPDELSKNWKKVLASWER